MQPKVSVIIPVYNAEKYLSECLDSVLCQTLRDIEVICVDDGSTDGSLSLLREYETRDSRLKTLTQQNEYAGVARNRGLNAASGRYCLFLDADDFFAPEMLEAIYGRACETEADIVLFGGRKYHDDTGEYEDAPSYLHSERLESGQVFSRKDFPEEILTISNNAPWTKLFDRDFIETNQLRFQALQNCNDMYFTMLAMCLAERIAYVPEPFANYRVGMTGNTQSRKEKDPTCFIEAYKSLYDALRERGVYPEVEKSYITHAVSGCLYNLDTLRSPSSRMAVYKGLTEELFPYTGLLDHPEEYYADPAGADRLRGIPYILACREQMSLRDAQSSLSTAAGEDTAAVSVVVPVYNMEKYLRDCLDSILGQTMRDMEILCVNDGSTDASQTVLEEYAARDDRIRIIRQENMGLSAARNTGARNAGGKYLYFMDSDDILEREALATLYERAERDDLTIVYFDAVSFADGGMDEAQIEHYRDYYIRSHPYDGAYSGAALMAAMSENGEYRSSACLQMVRRRFFLDHELWFIPGIIHEDNAFTFRSMVEAERVGYVGSAFFHRRVRPRSIMSSQYSYKNVIGYFICYLDMFEALCQNRMEEASAVWALELIYRILHNARNIYRELPAPERYAYLGLRPTEQKLFRGAISTPLFRTAPSMLFPEQL